MAIARILTLGVLALVAVLVVSAAIVVMAPYLAAFLIVSAVLWYCFGKEDPPSDPPTQIAPRE